jgi:hypothetical protein
MNPFLAPELAGSFAMIGATGKYEDHDPYQTPHFGT